MKSRVFDVLRAIFFPPRCAGCAVPLETGVLCAACAGSIAIARTLFCGQCDARLFGDKVLCHPEYPYVLGSPTLYANIAVQALVRSLKFGRRRAAAEPLVVLMKEYCSSLGNLFTDALVIPIPLSRRRLRARGFNQAELLARPLAGFLNLPFDASSFVRVRHTKPQTETKSAALRRENLRGCFAVRGRGAVTGRRILLVDDVTTTGTTFLEAARTLKAAGAETIFALAVAKVPVVQ